MDKLPNIRISGLGASHNNLSSNVTKQNIDGIYLEIGGHPIHPATKSVIGAGSSDIGGASLSGRGSGSRSQSKRISLSRQSRNRKNSRSSLKVSDQSQTSLPVKTPYAINTI